MTTMDDKEFNEKVKEFGKSGINDEESPIIRVLNTESYVFSILFFPDAVKLVSGGEYGDLRIFDLNNKNKNDTKGERICKKEEIGKGESILKICKIGNNKFAIGTHKGMILFFSNFVLEEEKTIKNAHSR